MPRKQPTATPIQPAVLNYYEAATYVGLSHATIKRLTEAGTLPFVRLSALRLGIRRVDLDAFIDARTERAQSERTG